MPNHKGIVGDISGIIVNEVFESHFGPTILKADGICTSMFAGTELFLLGRPVATVGDGKTMVKGDGNKLRVAVGLDAKLDGAQDVAEAIGDGDVTFCADWRGEPDRWEIIGGKRVAILDEWGLSRIEFADAEIGERGTCRVKQL